MHSQLGLYSGGNLPAHPFTKLVRTWSGYFSPGLLLLPQDVMVTAKKNTINIFMILSFGKTNAAFFKAYRPIR
jgi:hypothetical protein